MANTRMDRERQPKEDAASVYGYRRGGVTKTRSGESDGENTESV